MSTPTGHPSLGTDPGRPGSGDDAWRAPTPWDADPQRPQTGATAAGRTPVAGPDAVAQPMAPAVPVGGQPVGGRPTSRAIAVLLSCGALVVGLLAGVGIGRATAPASAGTAGQTGQFGQRGQFGQFGQGGPGQLGQGTQGTQNGQGALPGGTLPGSASQGGGAGAAGTPGAAGTSTTSGGTSNT